MKKIMYLLLCVVALTMTSCSTNKYAVVDDLRDLRTEIRDNGSEYGLRDWNHAKNKYLKIERRLQRYDYTQEEQTEIGQLKGECVGYFTKGVTQNVVGKFTGIATQLKGFIDGIKSAVKE